MIVTKLELSLFEKDNFCQTILICVMSVRNAGVVRAIDGLSGEGLIFLQVHLTSHVTSRGKHKPVMSCRANICFFLEDFITILYGMFEIFLSHISICTAWWVEPDKLHTALSSLLACHGEHCPQIAFTALCPAGM